MGRITKIDLKQINSELLKLEQLQKDFAAAKKQIDAQKTQLESLDSIHAPATSNNVTFTWTGSTHSLSWTAGSVKNKNGLNVPVIAGSISGLTANTYYWLAWNFIHRKMVADSNVENVFQNKNNLVICQVFTGTAGETGVAGGGGSNSATELSGAKYKNF